MLPSVLARSGRSQLRHTLGTLGRTRKISTDIKEESFHDVVIVGGGPAGLALATALGSMPAVKDNLSIALIEGGDLSKVEAWMAAPGAYSNRVSSITNTSIKFLQDIGAWGHIEQSRTCPIENMEVWDGISDSRISFSSMDMPIIPTTGARWEMARLTENLNLQRALLRRIKELSQSITVIDNQKVASINHDGKEGSNWPVVSLADGRALRTRLLIGADGFNSPVKSFAQISSYGWSYPTNAVVATLNHQPRSRDIPSPFMRPNTVAYQRFLPTGPIAFLPLSENVSSLVWSTTPQLAAALRGVHSDVLAKMVNAAFRLPDISINYLHSIILEHGHSITPELIEDEIRWREASHSIGPESALCSQETASVGIPPTGSEDYPPLVKSIQAGTAASFPLRLSHADSYIGEGVGARTALVGDAAHTVHPLAGQGLNMGLADAQALAETINKAVTLGGDIGTYTSLLPYHVARYTPNHAILSVTDKLHKLYSLTSPPAVWARSVGLEVVNELGSLKAALMGAAGAQDNSSTHAGAGWNAAARGVEAVSGGVQVGRAVLSGAGSVVAGLAQAALKSIGSR